MHFNFHHGRPLPTKWRDLREMVILFMRCKGEEVVAMKDWDKLVVNHPALATELMRSILKGSKEKHIAASSVWFLTNSRTILSCPQQIQIPALFIFQILILNNSST